MGIDLNVGVEAVADSANPIQPEAPVLFQKVVLTIGVVTELSEDAAVREFFELFKTPWEFCRPDRNYDIILSTTGEVPKGGAKLVLIYSSDVTALESANRFQFVSHLDSAVLRCQDDRIPVYGPCITFQMKGIPLALDEATQKPIIVKWDTGSTTFIRVGFDLFDEVRLLLEKGQPVENARIPTLELHIALLRELILNCSLPVVEIPAVPDRFSFIACLTHDMDHPSIRLHRFDHTIVGFLYRAVIGSLLKTLRGRLPIKKLVRNLFAAASLPFVHLHLARDFWLDFDRYLKLEAGLGSTFYFIPYKNEPGSTPEGIAPRKRASAYGVSDLDDCMAGLSAAGSEIGLHGIDAWIDSDKGTAEMRQIKDVVGTREIGLRMHWLYFDERSPAKLEQAGFLYDSTVGYNETVGYRSGTVQAYKPLSVSRLIELPLHIMDTALFYPSYLNLTNAQAKNMLGKMINYASRFGGVLTVNWHDRSIAPERLWDDFYVQLIDDLKKKGAWFPTASGAVAWFRSRRSVSFRHLEFETDSIRIEVTAEQGPSEGPGLIVRVYKPRAQRFRNGLMLQNPAAFVDMGFKEKLDIRIKL